MEIIGQYVNEIISLVVGLVGGSLLTLRLKKSTASNGARIVDQRSASAGGDVIAGDKITGTTTAKR